jgi:hypothetical protein
MTGVVSRKTAVENTDRKSDGRKPGQVCSNDYGLNFDSSISPGSDKNMTNGYLEMRGLMNAMFFWGSFAPCRRDDT